MQRYQKCCLHCPGRWTSTSKDRRDEHSCCLPTYVRGNLKLSSLRKPGCTDEADRSERLRGKSATKYQPDRPSSCYDRFAIAKKFHSENLQHQPLPDRVDDSVFTNIRNSDGTTNPRKSSQKRPSSGFDGGREISRLCRKVRPGVVQYGPTLGCKTPTTNMDLAICWEAPLDRAYEPPRAVHIDGTDGGPAPAIFALVEHELPRSQGDHRDPCRCFKSAVESYEAKFANVRNRCRCYEKPRPEVPRIHESDAVPEVTGSSQCWRCPDESETMKKPDDDRDLCEELNSIHINEEANSSLDGSGNSIRFVDSSNRKKLQPLHLRNCSSCECRGERSARKPRGLRLVQSACGATRNLRRNGLPTKIRAVPRPRTPYAKRSFCIDTLTPPFSIVEGCRDADYPEHWRLTSVYQQSYRNPRKPRPTILTYN